MDARKGCSGNGQRPRPFRCPCRCDVRACDFPPFWPPRPGSSGEAQAPGSPQPVVQGAFPALSRANHAIRRKIARGWARLRPATERSGLPPVAPPFQAGATAHIPPTSHERPQTPLPPRGPRTLCGSRRGPGARRCERAGRCGRARRCGRDRHHRGDGPARGGGAAGRGQARARFDRARVHPHPLGGRGGRRDVGFAQGRRATRPRRALARPRRATERAIRARRRFGPAAGWFPCTIRLERST